VHTECATITKSGGDFLCQVVGIDEQLHDTVFPAEFDVMPEKSFPLHLDERLRRRLGE
jgi:hypothetical protein